MTVFAYSGMLGSGKRVRGTVHCQDRRAAVEQLLSRGCHPVQLRPVTESDSSLGGTAKRLARRVPMRDLAVFTRQLASLLKAGLPMVQALATLRKQIQNKRLATVVSHLEETLTIEAGTLADALDHYPREFDAVYRGLVRAGEEGGNLVSVLEDMARHLTSSAKLRGQVYAAFLYPAFILLMGCTAVFVLLTFVIPRFEELFLAFGQSLPWITMALLKLSRFLSRWWWAVLLTVATAVMGLLLLLRIRSVRLGLDRRLLRLPVFGPMLLKIEVSRISRTFGTLLKNGVQIIDALRITGRTVRNRAIHATFDRTIQCVSAGEPLAGTLEQAKLYPPLVINMISTGEETGELSEMLSELSSMYEQEAQQAVSGAVKLLEPALIILMGGVIAAIVAAVMLPVFEANAMIQ